MYQWTQKKILNTFNLQGMITNFSNWLPVILLQLVHVPLLDDDRIQPAESFAVNFKTTGCIIQKCCTVK